MNSLLHTLLNSQNNTLQTYMHQGQIKRNKANQESPKVRVQTNFTKLQSTLNLTVRTSKDEDLTQL